MRFKAEVSRDHESRNDARNLTMHVVRPPNNNDSSRASRKLQLSNCKLAFGALRVYTEWRSSASPFVDDLVSLLWGPTQKTGLPTEDAVRASRVITKPVYPRITPCRFCESGKHTGHRLKEQDFEMTLRLLERSLHVEAHQRQLR